jgi:hypothetical protein
VPSPTFTASPTATPRPPTATDTARPGPTPSGRTLYLPLAGQKRRAGLAQGADRPADGAAGVAAPPAVGPSAVWSAPEEVARLPGDTSQLSVAVDAAGRPHVVWQENEQLRHAYRDVGGWKTPAQMAYGESPSLAVDATGVLHALFTRNAFDDNMEIYHVQFDGEHWSLPENVSESPTFSSAPTLRAGTAEVPLTATWSELGPDGPLVYYGFWDGRYWHTWPVTQARGQGPTLAMDDAGPILAWHARVADQPFDIFAARADSPRGTRWSLPENVSDTPNQDSVVASVALDPQTWHLVWQEGPPDAAAVAYSRRYDAGWGAVEPLSSTSTGPPKVLTAPGGSREVVWLDGTAVWSARGFGDNGWETGKVPPAAAGALAAAAASDNDGGLHLVWAESQPDGSAVLRYARRLGCDVCRAFIPLGVKRW